MRLSSTLLLGSFSAIFLACGDGGSSAQSIEVVTAVRTFIDHTRDTPPNADFEGSAERTLETRIWLTNVPLRSNHACASERCALVVLAHGFGGNTARFDAIGRGLAEAGYIVVAPRFPLTNEAAPGGHTTAILDTLDQPADLSFVIDRVLEANAGGSDALLGGRIDPDRIAVLGHSLGGVTAIAHSRVDCCADPRVDAVVAVAPVTVLVEGIFREPWDAEGPATLAMSGSEDPTVRPELPAGLYDSIESPRALLVLDGANHVDLIENTGPAAPALDLTRRTVVAFLDQFLGGGNELVSVLDELRAAGHTTRHDL